MCLASWLFEQIRTCNEQKDTQRAKSDQAAGNECLRRDAALKEAYIIPLSIMLPGRLSAGGLAAKDLSPGQVSFHVCTTILFYWLCLDKQTIK